MNDRLTAIINSPLLTLADRAELEEATRRFERAWLADKTPLINEDLLPIGMARIPTAVELCAIDVDFRRRRNLPVRADYYLQALPSLATDESFVRGLDAILLRTPESLSPEMLGRIAQRLRENRTGSDDSTAPAVSLRDTVAPQTLGGSRATLPHHSGINTSASLQLFHSMLSSGEEVATPVKTGEGAGESKLESLQLPAHLSDYRLVKFIARGSTGEVWYGRDERNQREVAIKITPHRVSNSGITSDDVRLRCREVSQDHPNMVPILHTSCDARYEYQVMPLLKGETLEIRLTRQRGMAPIEVARIGRELAAGLQRLHAAGLVHHDIKPANIWLDAITHRARLIDFGLAADYTDQSTPAALRGTPAYHAPEVVQGMPYLPQSDLYSLGVVLYECATGQRHNRGATVSSAQEFILHGRAPAIHKVNPEFPPELADIIERLLVRKTAARTKSATELDNQLVAWFASELLSPSQQAPAPIQSIALRMPVLNVAVWLIVAVVIMIGFVALLSPLVM